MPTFAFLNIDTIQSTKIYFSKLSRNGVCFLDEFELEINDNPQYVSEYKTLLSYIEMYSLGTRLPITKYREIQGTKFSQCEFKSKNLRIYAIQGNNGKVIVLGGYKKTQVKDLNRLENISKELRDYYETSRTDKQ